MIYFFVGLSMAMYTTLFKNHKHCITIINQASMQTFNSFLLNFYRPDSNDLKRVIITVRNQGKQLFRNELKDDKLESHDSVRINVKGQLEGCVEGEVQEGKAVRIYFSFRVERFMMVKDNAVSFNVVDFSKKEKIQTIFEALKITQSNVNSVREVSNQKYMIEEKVYHMANDTTKLIIGTWVIEFLLLVGLTFFQLSRMKTQLSIKFLI